MATDVGFTTITRKLTVGQIWAVLVAIAAVIAGTIAVSAYVTSAIDEQKVTAKDRELTKATTDLADLKTTSNAKISDLTTKLGQSDDKVKSLAETTASTARAMLAIQSKSDFLDRFLSYELLPNDANTKNLFVNYVCAMWKHSQEMSINVESQPLNLSPSQIVAGIPGDIRALLEKNGVPPIFFDNAQKTSSGSPAVVSPFIPGLTSPRPVVSPLPGEAIATIQKTASNITLVKTVHFNDGTTYTVPSEIASIVHQKAECAP